jgi:HNH endonuclease
VAKPIPVDLMPESIWDKIQVTGFCWEWIGSKDVRKPYGRVWFAGQSFKAHRVVFAALTGQDYPDLELDHLCRNMSCVNPDHLEPVDHMTNVHRGFGPMSPLYSKKQTCVNGHDYDVVGRTKGRGCRQCAKDATRRHQQRSKAKTR